MTPLDVATLERTCKTFATKPDQCRRIAIGNVLLCGKSSAATEDSLLKYVDSEEENAIAQALAGHFTMEDGSSIF